MFYAAIPFIEIGILAILVYFLLSLFWNSRSMDLMIGFGAMLLVGGISSILELPVLNSILLTFVNYATMGILIIFQPELRLVLSKLSLKGKRYREGSDFDKFLDGLSLSVYRLAEKKMGALIVLENEDSFADFANKAVKINAAFSSELLESIFSPDTPLHDGAVILHDSVIIAAAAILPLAEDSSQVTRSMGTRHRAALGASQFTDALMIVVSEETGKVSLAREGIMTRGVKIDRFKGIVRSVFAPPVKKPAVGTNKFWDWIKQ